MKRFNVRISFRNDSESFEKTYTVEAGSTKLAYIRAIKQSNEDGYSDYYKTIISIDQEEISDGDKRSAV